MIKIKKQTDFVEWLEMNHPILFRNIACIQIHETLASLTIHECFKKWLVDNGLVPKPPKCTKKKERKE